MFDPETVGLIQQAPALEGLDLAALPQVLTDAFATVVAARIRLRTGTPVSIITQKGPPIGVQKGPLCRC